MPGTVSIAPSFMCVFFKEAPEKDAMLGRQTILSTGIQEVE